MNANVDGSYCYKDDEKNCKKYGRLYTYEAASNVCPEGWELPSMATVYLLWDKSDAGFETSNAYYLKSTTDWMDDNNGDDLFGFNAYPAGGYESGDFIDLSTSAYFWMQPNGNLKEVIWFRYTSDTFETVSREEKNAYSVRCVKSMNL